MAVAAGSTPWPLVLSPPPNTGRAFQQVVCMAQATRKARTAKRHLTVRKKVRLATVLAVVVLAGRRASPDC